VNKLRPLIVLLALPLLVGCAGPYSTVRESAQLADLTKYPVLNVGWLDLGEQRYRDYGYTEADAGKWLTLISEANLKSLPQFLKEQITDKTIRVVRSRGEMPPGDGLVILFSDVKYNQKTSSAAQVMFGNLAGSDTLDVTIHFIDPRANREVYTTAVSVTSKAGMGYGSMAFDGRVTNTVYNLARFIAEKVGY